MSSVTFKFSKTIENKVKTNSSHTKENFEDSKADKDYVLSLENKRIKSTKSNEKKEYVIPLINAKDTNIDSLEIRAINEIIQETNSLRNHGRKEEQSNLTILLENREQMERNDNIISSIRASETDPNYESIPIEEYGKALLRGMGWKNDQPIGLRNKNVAKSIEPILRPKGMGLGAEKIIQLNREDKDARNKDQEKNLDEDQKIKGYIVGSPVVILKGSPYNDMYAMIQGLDEDNGRIIVKLALKDLVVSIPKYLTKPVSIREFEKCHRYLNKGKADEMDIKSKQKIEQSLQYGLIKLNQKEDHEEIKVELIEESFDEKFAIPTVPITWVKPHLVVRIVDPEYDGGTWYEKKIHVLKVSPDKKDSPRFTLKCIPLNVSAQDEARTVVKLRSLTDSMLETVLPKISTFSSGADNQPHVMIVKGSHAGRVGQLIHKDKRTLNVTVKFRDERHKRTKVELPFEFVCEYRPLE